MIIRYVTSFLLLVGVVEAAQNCPAGTVPTLDGQRIEVVHSGNRIDITGSPEWGACVPTSSAQR